MKKNIYLILVALFTSFPIFAQVTGDYRTGQASVTWSTAAHWEIFNGTIWETASSKPGATNSVYIQNGHTATLTGNEACNDLHINKDNSHNRLALGTNTLEINGKIRAYTGSIGTIPGTSSTSPSGNDDWITSTTGKISVVGNSRNLTVAGEWGVGIANVSSPDGFDLEINLNSDQTATFNTFFKCRSFNVVAGTLNMAIDARMAPAQNTRANSNFIIQSGATVISAASGSTTDVVFAYDDDSISDTLWVKSGGKLILTGATPYIGMNTIIFDGTVEYGREGNQSTAARAHGGTFANLLTNLTLSGSGTKTIVNSDFTVNGTFSIQGSATLNNNGANFTYGASSILEYASSTANQTMSTNEFNTSGTRVPPNLVINNTFGTVTLNSNRTTFAGNLTVSAGTFNLSTFTINRSSAGGSLTVSNGATLKIGGTNSLPSNYTTHSIGESSTIEYGGTTQNIASLNSSQNFGNLIISGSGTKTATAELRVNGNLILTAGTIADGGFQLIVYGNITGTGTHTSSGEGEIQMETDGTTVSGVTVGNFKIFSGGTITAVANMNITGNLQIIDGVFDDGGFTVNRSTPGGSLTIANDGTLKIGGTNSFPSNYTTHSIGETSTIEYSGTNQTIAGLNSSQRYRNLILSGSGTKTLGATLETDGLVLSGGVTLANNSFNLDVFGNVTGTGTFSGSGGLRMLIHGSTISGITVSNLILDLGGNISLTADLNITEDLNFVLGTLSLGANNLILNSAATITGNSNTKFIITNSTGVLTRNSVGASNTIFPVGTTSSYNPVILNNAGTSDNFSVRVKTSFDNAPANSDGIVNRAWDITESVGGGSDVTITLQWNLSEEAGSFNRNTGLNIGRYNGSEWVESSASLSGSDPYTASASNFTSFSEFGIGSAGALPVELTSFTASSSENAVNLNWVTATEVNNFGFEIERKIVGTSRDLSEIWATISFIKGNGNSNSPKEYSFTDKPSENGKYYYRLKQMDNDGKFEYSNEIEVDINLLPTEFVLSQNYPNPFNPSTVISYQLSAFSNVKLTVYDLLGNEVTVLVNKEQEAGVYNFEWNGSGLSSGVYYYKINAVSPNGEQNFTSVKKMLLLK
jgi:hypothetical protein